MSRCIRAAVDPGERWLSILMWSDTDRRHLETHAFGIGEARVSQYWWKWAPKVLANCAIVYHHALSLYYPKIRSYLLHLSGGTHSRLAGAVGLRGTQGH